jgi:Phosphotransferase enzyme family
VSSRHVQPDTSEAERILSSIIPSGPEAVTSGWISEVTGWPIDAVDIEEIGAGLGVSSAVYRVRLRGHGCPPSVVVKLSAKDPNAVFTSTVLSMYRREVAFFDQLAARAPMRVPIGYHGAVSDDGSEVAIVMEDLIGNRVCDQVVGMSERDAAAAVDALARWHAQWWNDVDGLADRGCALALGNDLYPAVLPALFDEGWAKLIASASCPPPSGLIDIGPRFGVRLAGLLQELDHAPVTLLHGDYRADNLMFSPEGDPIAIDFQLIHTGSGAYDLAYFITQSLDAAVARGAERPLFDRWVDGLRTAGVPAADLDGMWERYRVAALFCIVYPVIAARGMDLDVPREAGLVNTMMARLGSAAAALDLADLL